MARTGIAQALPVQTRPDGAGLSQPAQAGAAPASSIVTSAPLPRRIQRETWNVQGCLAMLQAERMYEQEGRLGPPLRLAFLQRPDQKRCWYFM